MRLLFLALVVVLLPAALRASVTALPKPPPPGWQSENYATVVARCADAEMAVFEYMDGTKTFVTDPTWLAEFKAQLACLEAKPDALCLCINYPRVHLVAKDKELVTVELAHSNKIRFGGSDFILPQAKRDALAKLFGSVKAAKIELPKRQPKK
ncbi:MAG: hypothetical protein HYV96_02085 [Opitutae bacterium]|nr:hypothetical protein [Opitutae bacterium]